MPELPKAYDPASVESDLYEDWHKAGLFHAEPDDPGEPFSIVIPLPNVTGALHIGHAITNSIEDAMVRHARMQGRNAVWIPGTDHAGIATQNVVERQLADEGLTRHDLGREAFIERVWRWKEESGGVILTQLQGLGASLDWEREAFTLDEPRSRAVREVFVGLYEQGLIYRGNRLINWCPRCATALSDIEVDHEDVAGELVRFRYPFADGDGGVDGGAEGPEAASTHGAEGIEVATTRAETMLGDTAVAVHPDDARYADLVGRKVAHPFLDRELTVIADDHVDPEFGTGAVKITPAHDPNDHAIGQRHDLDSIEVLTEDAVVSDAGGRFAGLDRFDARQRVKDALDEAGLLVGVDAHTHAVGHCSRCGTVVEPRLSDQWFVEVRPLADKAIGAVEAGRTTFIPERFTGWFLDWLRNLHDWCISRQIWWGHRIPVWYCPDGHRTVAREDPSECDTCGSDQLEQDPDVLDTWFSSQLWPFAVFGWEGPDSDTPELRTWYPTTILETGYDINTFWVSRMLMIGLWFLDEVPFRTVFNHGMVRDGEGKKMSKSFGNVIDPREFIQEHGADALRFALFQHCSPGTDVPLAPDWVEGARRFANKLWNAARFALATLEGTRPGEVPSSDELTLEDRWILSRLAVTRQQVEDAYETYDWAVIAQALYHFTWDELADWYLESVKPRMYETDQAGPGSRVVAQRVLAAVLDDLLRLLHPLMPFVTEAIWRELTGAVGGQDSLMVAAWPGPRSAPDPDGERAFGIVQDLVTEVRKFRSSNGVAPSTRFPLTLVTSERVLLERHATLVTSLAGISQLDFADSVDQAPGRSRIVFGAGEAHVELAGLIDVDGELARLARDLSRAEDDLSHSVDRLGNQQFVDRAPTEVVDRERARHDDLQRVLSELRQQIDQLEGLRSP